MNRIIIEINGGVVQAVLTDQPADTEVIILDWDNGLEPYREHPQSIDSMSTDTAQALRDLERL